MFAMGATPAPPPTHPPFSFTVFTTLLVIFGASLWVFYTLVSRSTVRRKRVALSEWARGRGAKVVEDAAAPLPERLAMLAPYHPQASLRVRARRWTILEMTTDPPPESRAAAPQWHVLARELDTEWPPTGLRPTAHAVSLLDLLSMSSFPSLSSSGRFILFGTDSAAARVLADSWFEALLPPDVGLAVHGRMLLLDFSTRPFDTIEFGRMLALVEQLATHLPPAPAQASPDTAGRDKAARA